MTEEKTQTDLIERFSHALDTFYGESDLSIVLEKFSIEFKEIMQVANQNTKSVLIEMYVNIILEILSALKYSVNAIKEAFEDGGYNEKATMQEMTMQDVNFLTTALKEMMCHSFDVHSFYKKDNLIIELKETAQKSADNLRLIPEENFAATHKALHLIFDLCNKFADDLIGYRDAVVQAEKRALSSLTKPLLLSSPLKF